MKLKAILMTIFVAMLTTFTIGNAEAQLFDKIKREVKNKAENRVVNKAGKATDNAMDKTEKTAGNAVKGDKTKKSEAPAGSNQSATENSSVNNTKVVSAGYKNYDFVPGDKIIFQPDLSGETDAELPARFIVQMGNAEIQTHDGEKIVHLGKGGRVKILPLMDSKSYLPEQFTIEFDFMYDENPSQFHTFGIELRNSDDKTMVNTAPHNLTLVNRDRFEWGDVKASRDQLPADLTVSLKTPGVWHHMAIYVRKNLGKAYVNQYRVAASNTLPSGFGFVDVATDGYCGMKIKNFRLAAGGDDKYNKIVTDGKFITHGIQFDVNKSTIKQESMGALNEIVKLMKEHSDLKFEINGHTDSDGKADANLKLSEARAAAVKDQLKEMGIAENRLTIKGNGASKPIDNNNTAEGKANNRRVEFVKI